MGPSKAELLDETSCVTLELRNLKDKMGQYRRLFEGLESRRQQVRRSYFPPKYFLMKDMVREYSIEASNMTMEKGFIPLYVESIKTLRKHQTIKNELKELKKAELNEELKKASGELVKTKADLQKARDRLQDLAHLYRVHKYDRPWSRYRNLLHGVKDILRSFNEISSDCPS